MLNGRSVFIYMHIRSYVPLGIAVGTIMICRCVEINTPKTVVVVLFYVHGKHLRHVGTVN